MNYAKPVWRDGQPFSTDFDDVYFSADNGVAETEHVFIRHNQLLQRFAQCVNEGAVESIEQSSTPACSPSSMLSQTQGQNQGHTQSQSQGPARQQGFVIAETGFGSGLNFLITAKHWLQQTQTPDMIPGVAPSAATDPARGTAPDAARFLRLTYYSIENTPFSTADLKLAQQAWPELTPYAEELQKQYQVASYGFHCFDLFAGRIRLVLLIGDVQVMLPQLQGSVDAWFLDGFAPSLNPQMWNEQVFAEISRLSHPGSSFSTYTSVGEVRRGLMAAGFTVNKVSGCGKKRHMLCGVMSAEAPGLTVSKQPWYEWPGFNKYGFNKYGSNQSGQNQSGLNHPDSQTAQTDDMLKSGKPQAVCIIGAGIAGLCTAWSLVKRGYQVELIEAGEQIGAQASGNPRAMLMPRLSLQDAADAEFYTSAYFYALRCLAQLDENQQCWQQTGGLQLPSSERIKKQMAEYPADKALAYVLDAASASQLSGLQINQSAQYFPQAACLYPEKILQLLVQQMGDSLSLRTSTEVASFDYANQQWQLKNKQQEKIGQADILILASSWQTKHFTQTRHLHLQPARGQLTQLSVNKRSEQLRMPIAYDGYLLPAAELPGSELATGKPQHVSGASFELDDCDTTIRDTEHQQNLQDLAQWFDPLFDTADISGGRASVRAVSPDRLPIVGPAPLEADYNNHYADLHKGKPAEKYVMASYHPGLFVNTGHGARGFTSAFLSAELLAAYITDEALPVANRVRYALHPARFLIRTYKKKRAQ